MGEATLDEQLQAFVGRSLGAPVVAPDAVNQPMIRHLVEALGDRNPAYTDAAFAAASVHGGIVAPATSLQVWTMQGLPEQEWKYRGEPDSDDDESRLMNLFEEHGFGGVVATNTEQTYHRYLRPGDLLSMPSVYESIVGPKQTGLGEGYFVTVLQSYLDQHGELVGTNRIRFLKFRPPEASGPPPELPRPSTPARVQRPAAPGTPPTPTLSFDEVEVGAELPPLVLDLTPTLILTTAIATRDYQPVHHDRDYARDQGMPDIIMNILTSNGFVGRFVTDWAGPEALVRSASIRLGVPNFPYDAMTITGQVTGKEIVDDDAIVEVEARGCNSLGDHVKGKVRVALPRSAA